MQREIKFRAWAEGELDMRMFTWDDTRQLISEWIANAERGAILMQFTGLKDKNGKEIYEGDIVEIWTYTSENGERQDVERYEVSCMAHDNYPAFDLKGWGGECNGLSDVFLSDEWSYEVIGNIYENADLLANSPKI